MTTQAKFPDNLIQWFYVDAKRVSDNPDQEAHQDEVQ